MSMYESSEPGKGSPGTSETELGCRRQKVSGSVGKVSSETLPFTSSYELCTSSAFSPLENTSPMLFTTGAHELIRELCRRPGRT